MRPTAATPPSMSTSRPDSCTAGKVLGILGGTFDPVHCGHRALADAALASGAVSRVRWIPAGQPPHRSGPVASAEQRLAMVRLLIADQPAFELDTSEVDAAALGAPSYTVDTLLRLRATLGPEQPLALILGADAFLGLPSWHRWREIPALTHFLVTSRPGSVLDAASLPDALHGLWSNARIDDPALLGHSPGGKIFGFAMPPRDISATLLRQRLRERGTTPDVKFDGLLSPEVVRYIRHHHLYC